jgi:hypothetical protein
VASINPELLEEFFGIGGIPLDRTVDPDDGDVLTWVEVDGVYRPAAVAAGVATIDDLSDVTITTPVAGSLLRYNGSAWVNAALKRVLVHSPAAQTLTDNAAQATVATWNTEAYDVGDWFAGGSPSLLTVPAGVTFARVGFRTSASIAGTPNAAGYLNAQIIKNGSAISPSMFARVNAIPVTGSIGAVVDIWSPILAVTAGDAFAIQMSITGWGANAALGTSASSWFAAEEVFA